MGAIKSFRDLEAWQKAMALAERCYKLTESLLATEKFGLSGQLRRAAVSIPSNIAEGHRPRSRKIYIRHLKIALGSQAELETDIELACRLRLVGESEAAETKALAQEVGRLLHGLVRALERPFPAPHPPTPNP